MREDKERNLIEREMRIVNERKTQKGRNEEIERENGDDA